MKKPNIAKQQNEQLVAALLTPRTEGEERVSARAGRSYVCVKKANVEAVRIRLLGAHRLGANSNGRKKEDRWYPPFETGKTSTADYVGAYQRLNSRINFSDWKFSHADNIAPTYADGALDFDPVEDHEEQDAEDSVADLL